MDNYEYTELLKSLNLKMDNITGVVEPEKLQSRLATIEEL
ncbi:MAG: peptide chain release factor 2, partial [Campylobacterota bacterium]|nr:peptide chain release factor 2 [Campylobacterota bacterium]